MTRSHQNLQTAGCSIAQHRDLMEIVEERYGRRSTIATSQLPVETLARCHR